MMALVKVIVFLGVCALGHGQMYDDLYGHIFHNYYQRTMPRNSMTDIVNVTVAPFLIEVKALDASTGQCDLEIWLQFMWNDHRLSWNQGRSNISRITVQPSDVWMPDVTLYNGEMTNLYKEAQVVVDNDGSIMYIPRTNFRIRCGVTENPNTTTFYCHFKMGSWVYNGQQLDVNTNGVDLSEYRVNKFVSLINATATKHTAHYACCPEPYPSLFFNLTFQGQGFP